ncbi:hypothetical protein [Streptomyces cadmiisoli]|uniref:hypothetical protein n=1 Tax=Streptomyces cadmiisoli TaxID=2184053 RepID=UPI003652FBEA
MLRQHCPDLRPPRSAPSPCDRAPRLLIPTRLSTSLGYDAVGTPGEYGPRIMDRLPRVGCVFADDRHWWWIVPAGSHEGVVWPSPTAYAVGARMADPSWTPARPKPRADMPRLIHSPSEGSPYTPPIPLYFLICRLTGSNPRWSPGATE